LCAVSPRLLQLALYVVLLFQNIEISLVLLENTSPHMLYTFSYMFCSTQLIAAQFWGIKKGRVTQAQVYTFRLM
jgi:hypothetical protein